MPHYPEGDGVYTICKYLDRKLECRYLAVIKEPSLITRFAGEFSCEKKSPLKPMIDRRVASGQLKTTSDNCKGLDWR